jgi:hypothetical protein
VVVLRVEADAFFIDFDPQKIGVEASNISVDSKSVGGDARNEGPPVVSIGADAFWLSVEAKSVGVGAKKLGVEPEEARITLANNRHRQDQSWTSTLRFAAGASVAFSQPDNG